MFEHEFINGSFFVVAYCGALSNYYSLHELIEVAKVFETTHTEVRFIIAGAGSDLQLYKQLSRGLYNIDFIGSVPKSSVNAILSKSDVGYLPLRPNRFNLHGISTNKLYDYMFHSLPVLGLYKTDYDIVTQHGFGVVETNYNIDSLARKLSSLVEKDRKELILIGRRGKELLNKKYSNRAVSEAYKDLLDEL